MKRINLLLLFSAMWIFGMGWFTNRVFQSSTRLNSQIYQENDSLKSELISKDSIIFDLQDQVEILQDDIQLREGEISYWGQKYDSLRSKDGSNNWP
jgi:hypothetical protein